MKTSMALARGMIVYLIVMTLTRLLGFLHKIILSRWLGASDFGLFSLGIAVFTLIATITITGVSLTMSRQVAFYRGEKNNERLRSTMRDGMLIVLGISIICVVMLFFFANIIAHQMDKPELGILLQVMAFMFPFYCCILTIQKIMEGFQKIGWSVTTNLMLNGLRVIIALIAIFVGAHLFGITLTFVIATALTAIITFILYTKLIPQGEAKESTKSASSFKELLVTSWPLTISLMVHTLMTWGDTVILGFFRTAKEVGVYNLAIPAANLLTLPYFTAETVLLPLLSNLLSQSQHEEVIRLYKTATKWIFLVVCPLFIFILSFPKHIMATFGGVEFTTGVVALILASIGVFSTSLAASANIVLLANNKTKWMMKNSIMVAIASIILNITLAKKYGVNGAATAFLISGVMIAILRIGEAGYITKASPFSFNMAKVTGVGIVTAALIYGIGGGITPYIPHGLIFLVVNAFIIGIIYIALLFICKCFDEEDKTVINAILAKIKQKSAAFSMRR